VDLVLHRVDGRGRVNLDGIVDKDVEFYTAERLTGADGTETGAIVLSPVKIATTAVKRTSDNGPNDPFNTLPQ
jgi:hypothetical protein